MNADCTGSHLKCEITVTLLIIADEGNVFGNNISDQRILLFVHVTYVFAVSLIGRHIVRTYAKMSFE